MQFDNRKSGISLIGDLPWGSHFCQFYRTREDLIDIFIPYLKAGLENNEFCLLVASCSLGIADAKRALKKAIPDFDKYSRKKQIEIIPFSRCHAEKSGGIIASMVDKAVSIGFDGLRLACSECPAKGGVKVACHGVKIINKHNALALFAYPREKFDTVGVMNAVKNHSFALVKNTGKWEVMESSEARMVNLVRINRELEEEIAERLESERRIATTNSLLKLYPLKFMRSEYLDAAVELIRDWSGCRYTGIRIADKDGNIPYESCVGFSSEFLASESLLSLKLNQCACTRVVLGSPEPQDMPAMTRGGSFYCNDTINFVEGLTEEEKARFRGVCVRSGFLSVAVVPIFYRERIVGAIHLADERKGLVPLKNVEFIERLALIIGEALFRFKIEEELRQLNEDLEQRVIERTSQLEASNRELEAFSYSVSHDLRAPLRSIDGFGQALLEDYAGKLDDTGKDYLNRIRGASQHMAQLIDDLLNLSRVLRTEMRRDDVNLSNAVNKVADRLRKTHPDRQVEFIIAGGLTAHGDGHLLNVILDNLIGNAWKFTERCKHAAIEFGKINYDNNPVYFVKDNGAGFDMSYVDKLFNPFQRLHKAEEFPGTGIGLATVKRIIERHGGRVWIEGEVNKGATVYFTL